MKVAIAGYGIEGKANYMYWRDLGHDVMIFDERELSAYELPYGTSAVLGKNAFKHLKEYDLVVRTASLPPTHIKTRGKVWSGTNEFFDRCPAPIIGVTGTKGKGTTASLIASILRAAGKTVHLVGNIGTPALEVLPTITPDDIVVYELSSFQLWDLEKSPHIAVVLMIEADHLDIHKNFKDYVAAKANIRRHQGLDDYCIYHPTNAHARTVAETGDWPQDKQEREQWIDMARRYATDEEGQVYTRNDSFYVNGEKLCEVSSLQLPGAHNVENACAAISAARHYTVDDEAIEKGLRDFTGLPHRLKFVKTVRDVSYFDDSIATTPGSAMAAIYAFTEPKVLILGGKDKGADYKALIKLCAQQSVQVIAVGSMSRRLVDMCKKEKVAVTEVTSRSMDDIVTAAQTVASGGSVVILSPAAASFDMFKSYSDRGEQFVTAVEKLS